MNANQMNELVSLLSNQLAIEAELTERATSIVLLFETLNPSAACDKGVFFGLMKAKEAHKNFYAVCHAIRHGLVKPTGAAIDRISNMAADVLRAVFSIADGHDTLNLAYEVIRENRAKTGRGAYKWAPGDVCKVWDGCAERWVTLFKVCLISHELAAELLCARPTAEAGFVVFRENGDVAISSEVTETMHVSYE